MSKFFDNLIVRTVGIAAVVLVVFVLAVNFFLSAVTRHGKEIVAPDFTNMTYAEAKSVADAAGVNVIVSDSVYVRRMRPGAVYMQTPKAGTNVKQGRNVRLITNTTMPKEVNMPSLVGCSLRQAKAELLRSGLVLGRLIYVDDIATNVVLKQQRYGKDIMAGTPIYSGTTINLVLGLNEKDHLASVPNLVGQQYLKAVDILQENSLNPGRLVFDENIKDYADSVGAVVYSQRPAVEDSIKVVKGAEVTLYLK